MTNRRSLLLACVSMWLGAVPVLAAPGDLDPSFADAGRLRMVFGFDPTKQHSDFAAQADGKLVTVEGDCHFGSTAEFILCRYNLDGTLDASFGEGGKVHTSFGWGPEVAATVAIQPDGKIIAAGHADRNIVVARYFPDGSLDSSWSGDGKVTFSITENLNAYDVAVQSDGKVIVAGKWSFQGFLDQFAIARFNSNGTPDASWGGFGLVVTSFEGDAQATDLAIQSDGKIVAVGRMTDPFVENDHVAIARYSSNGALDPSFHFDGKLWVLDEGSGTDVAMQAGTSQANPEKIVVSSWEGFFLYRFNLDGQLDASFGGDGKVQGPQFAEAGAVRIRTTSLGVPDRILAVGRTTSSPHHVILAQFLLDGTPDAGFGGGDGQVTTPIPPLGGSAYAMALSGGKISVAGYASIASGRFDPLLVRYNADGSIDTGFDGDGMRVETDLGGGVSTGRAIAIQPDGKIVVAGTSQSAAGNNDWAIMRCNADGTLDSAFGQGGRVTTALGTLDDIIQAVAIQADGKIVVAGSTLLGGTNTEIAVARYLPNGTLDPTFSGDGIEVTPGTPSSDDPRDLLIQPDGKIVIVGYSNVSGTGNIVVLRYHPTGILDRVLRDPLGLLTVAANAVVLQPDGKLVVAGGGHNGTSTGFVAVRLLADFSFDSSFDGDGKKFLAVGPTYDLIQAALLDADGRIVLAGSSQNGSFLDVAIVRTQADGSLDPSFDGDGIATYPIGAESDYGFGLARQTNGKLVVGGGILVGSTSDFALLRVLDNGSPDPTYGNNGRVVVDLDGGSPDTGWALAMDTSGRAVVAGDAGGVVGVIRVLGDAVTSADGNDVETATAGWRLEGPRPNPMRGGTSIAFDLVAPASVSVMVFDVRGRLVRHLSSARRFEIGRHAITWDGRDDTGAGVASGVYLLRADRGSHSLMRSVTVVR